jgi:hypothetical protein
MQMKQFNLMKPSSSRVQTQSSSPTKIISQRIVSSQTEENKSINQERMLQIVRDSDDED